jgi:hypothetical protein
MSCSHIAIAVPFDVIPEKGVMNGRIDAHPELRKSCDSAILRLRHVEEDGRDSISSVSVWVFFSTLFSRNCTFDSIYRRLS